MTRPIDDLFGDLSKPLGPTDWPEPAQLRRKAEHKRTVRRVTVASSVAVVAAFAVAVPATLANHHTGSLGPGSNIPLGAGTSTVAAPTSAPTPGVTASPSAGSTATPLPMHADSPAPGVTRKSPLAPGQKAPTGDRHTYGPISIVVPHGWQEAEAPELGYAQPTTKVCIAPPVTANQKTFDSCAGLEIWYDGFLPGAYGSSFEGNRETSPAWFHADTEPRCPGTATKAGPLATALGGPDVWDFYWVGTKSATHNAWSVTCADGTTFRPQAWYLPKSHILFWSYMSDPTAQAILATVH